MSCLWWSEVTRWSFSPSLCNPQITHCTLQSWPSLPVTRNLTVLSRGTKRRVGHGSLSIPWGPSRCDSFVHIQEQLWLPALRICSWLLLHDVMRSWGLKSYPSVFRLIQLHTVRHYNSTPGWGCMHLVTLSERTGTRQGLCRVWKYCKIHSLVTPLTQNRTFLEEFKAKFLLF